MISNDGLGFWDASLALAKELRALRPLAEHVSFRARHTIWIYQLMMLGHYTDFAHAGFEWLDGPA